MCGRYTLHHPTSQVVMRFGVQEVLAAPADERYNIAPSQPILVVVQEADRRELDTFQWGLIPSWAKDPTIGNKLINARAETLAEKPSFRNALTRRRCLIPSDGFYEWQKVDGKRQPMYIRRRDGDLFAFAGLWEEWKEPDGTTLRTCAIITVPANNVVSGIHDRMPAMLRPEQEALWLDPSLKSAPDLTRLLMPYADEDMETYAVSPRVNRPANDDPACIAGMTANA
jgi:putative SOS response-associated peptidase YedK